MDDPHRQPRDGDRNPLSDRIRRAVAEGRISAADGEIRLTNVASAQSMTELGLILRDLDQLDEAIPAGSPLAFPAPINQAPAGTGVPGAARMVPLLVLGLAVGIITAGAIGIIAFRGSGDSSSSELRDPLPIATSAAPGSPAGVAGADPAPTPSAAASVPYRLDGAGIKRFLADYRREFSTTKVVDLTLYDEYAIVRVPIPRQRHTGWRYADGQFREFGPARANFPGSATLDTARLNLEKLLRNVATARRTLNVEDYDVTYVVLNYRPGFDEEPNVNIYVSNEFSESGYLATTLDGRIERSYPFGG